MNTNPNVVGGKGKLQWKCVVCGAIVEGDTPPEKCPVCGVGPEQFVPIATEPVTFTSHSMDTIIIIGNGAAGTAAAEEIRRRNRTCSVEIISMDSAIGYNRPMLTKGILSDFDMADFFIKPFGWYGENNIRLTLDTEVVKADPAKKLLELSDGSCRTYDKLILATGAECFIPPFVGADKKGVFSIRSLSNVNEIRDFIDQREVRSAAVIGGGVLGLEAAWELKKHGIDVTVIEAGAVIMGKQLDEMGAKLLLAAMDKAGVQASIGKGVAEISGSEYTDGVLLADGTKVGAELVIISTGVKQNIETAKQLGAEVTRSIRVNDRLETGVDGVYACGDCAEYNGVNYAIWPQALDMGRVAGANAAGDDLAYEPTIPAVTFHGMATEIFSIGDNGKDPQKVYDRIEHVDEENIVYEKLYFCDDYFCGGILIGNTTKQPELMKAFAEKRRKGELRKDE